MYRLCTCCLCRRYKFCIRMLYTPCHFVLLQPFHYNCLLAIIASYLRRLYVADVTAGAIACSRILPRYHKSIIIFRAHIPAQSSMLSFQQLDPPLHSARWVFEPYALLNPICTLCVVLWLSKSLLVRRRVNSLSLWAKARWFGSFS